MNTPSFLPWLMSQAGQLDPVAIACLFTVGLGASCVVVGIFLPKSRAVLMVCGVIILPLLALGMSRPMLRAYQRQVTRSAPADAADLSALTSYSRIPYAKAIIESRLALDGITESEQITAGWVEDTHNAIERHREQERLQRSAEAFAGAFALPTLGEASPGASTADASQP